MREAIPDLPSLRRSPGIQSAGVWISAVRMRAAPPTGWRRKARPALVCASPLLNDLVDASQEIAGYREPELLRRLEVEHQLEFLRLAHRQLRGLRAFEDATGVDARLAIDVGEISAVAHQAAGRGIFAGVVGRRQAVARGQRDERVPMADENRVGANQ